MAGKVSLPSLPTLARWGCLAELSISRLTGHFRSRLRIARNAMSILGFAMCRDVSGHATKQEGSRAFPPDERHTADLSIGNGVSGS